MFRELMDIMTSEMMTSRSLICLLENQNGGKLQKHTYNLFQNQKSTNSVFILPRKYNRQRRQLLFLVCLQVSEKSGVMKENCWKVVLVVVHRVFYSHFIISHKKYDMVAKTSLYIIIILCFVNKFNSSVSNFGGRLSQPKKIKLFLGISFFLPT
jgi:hypothetical protein